MSLIDRFFPKGDTDFANHLAERIARHFPPTSEPKLVKQGGKRRLEFVLELIIKDLDEFSRTQKPGWLRKARLGNTFRWKLVEIGYSEGFVIALTEGLVKHVAASKQD
jgi:hypothetical protein